MSYCMTVVKHVHLFTLQYGGCLYSVYTRDLLMSARGTDYIVSTLFVRLRMACGNRAVWLFLVLLSVGEGLSEWGGGGVRMCCFLSYLLCSSNSNLNNMQRRWPCVAVATCLNQFVCLVIWFYTAGTDTATYGDPSRYRRVYSYFANIVRQCLLCSQTDTYVHSLCTAWSFLHVVPSLSVCTCSCVLSEHIVQVVYIISHDNKYMFYKTIRDGVAVHCPTRGNSPGPRIAYSTTF